jgi:hypothetical protein
MVGGASANPERLSYPPVCPFPVVPALVAGIHVFFVLTVKKTRMAGYRRAEATPFSRRLCPAMTIEDLP